jgi:hypothetical protein
VLPTSFATQAYVLLRLGVPFVGFHAASARRKIGTIYSARNALIAQASVLRSQQTWAHMLELPSAPQSELMLVLMLASASDLLSELLSYLMSGLVSAPQSVPRRNSCGC